MTSRARLALIAATLAGAMLASRASAQSSLQVPIQFDFLNPGARSLALGGAFVGVADDATAALVNPAGLIELTRTELSVEGRVRRFEQPVLTGGRLSGAPTGIGEDTVAGPVFTTISNWQASPAFLAYVHPRGSWRIAAFRHDLIQLTQDFSSRGPFQNHGFDNRDSAFTATRTLNITSYGASVARQWPRLWVGGGLFVQHFSLGFDFQRFFHTTFYGAPDPAQAVFHFTQEGDDVGVGAVASAMVPLKRTKIGVSYKRGARFDYTSFSGGLFGTQQQTVSTFTVPDTLAVGASASIGQALIVSAEYTLVRHSQVMHDYVSVLVAQGESRERADRFTIADAHEVHAGVEYLVPVTWRPAVRAGVWYDPDHSVHYSPTPANDLLDERIAAALNSGRDSWHYTFGTMVAVHPRVDISAAVDRSSRMTVVSTSAIVRF